MSNLSYRSEVSKGRKEKAKGCRYEAYEAPKKT
jgi:hypothetical protein